MMPLFPLLFACGDRPTEPAPSSVPLSPEEQLVRVSMALRGLRPSVVDLERIHDDPAALPDLVDTWLDSPEFGATIRDLHAERLLIRNDTEPQPPARGLLEGQTTEAIFQSSVEEPLVLIEKVVTGGRPYTDIVTADTMYADALVATMYGLPYDPAGPEWQETRWADGRDQAGVLTSSQVWRRHASDGANFHRGRAAFITRTFLCDDLSERDVTVEGSIDLADEVAVADAVSHNPSCQACHQALEPLASMMWGFRGKTRAQAINLAFDQECYLSPDVPRDPADANGLGSDLCYPLVVYNPVREFTYRDYGLPEPAYYGEALEPGNFQDLGHRIAADPRFAQCAVRSFTSWFTQREADTLPTREILDEADRFAAEDFDAKALVRRLVLSEAFLSADGVVPLQAVRPEQYARTIEDLTGFHWLAMVPEPDCSEGCWGAVDLGRSDLLGYRAMAGGIDSRRVVEPTHTPTPTKALVLGRWAAEAAGHVVDGDFATAGERRLLQTVEADTIDEERVRAELVRLHLRILGEWVTADDPIVDETWALWDTARRRHDPTTAWKLVIAALLQDPRMGFY